MQNIRHMSFRRKDGAFQAKKSAAEPKLWQWYPMFSLPPPLMDGKSKLIKDPDILLMILNLKKAYVGVWPVSGRAIDPQRALLSPKSESTVGGKVAWALGSSKFTTTRGYDNTPMWTGFRVTVILDKQFGT